MRKMNNKGFSMVEILISVAIFSLLMVPIVGAIISSLKSTTDAKTLQYRNEFVENVVEYVKQDSLESIFAGSYFTTVGSYTDSGAPIAVSGEFYTKTAGKYDSSLEPIANALGSSLQLPIEESTITTGADRTLKIYPYEEYTISGKVDLGVKDTTYAYKMQISNKYYAEKEAAEGFINPNNLALGVVEDIDYTKVALINGTIANYDQTVQEAMLTKKVGLLRQLDPDWYDIYVQQQYDPDIFTEDTAKRLITIKVSGKADKGYKVTCNMKYNDNGATIQKVIANNTVSADLQERVRTELTEAFIEYEPFEFNYPVDPTTNVATLPNIYLMYNVCLYNGKYASNDFIAIDTTELEDNPEVNLFIVETAETYSDNITDASTNSSYVTAGQKLYNDNTDITTSRDSVKIHLGAVKGSDLQNVSVYHNFNLYGQKNVNKTNTNILYTNLDNNYYDSLIFKSTEYVPLQVFNGSGATVTLNKNQSVANFGALNDAEEASRGLYEIKVWMVEGDDPNAIDTSTTPLMTATKGGNDS